MLAGMKSRHNMVWLLAVAALGLGLGGGGHASMLPSVAAGFRPSAPRWRADFSPGFARYRAG